MERYIRSTPTKRLGPELACNESGRKEDLTYGSFAGPRLHDDTAFLL